MAASTIEWTEHTLNAFVGCRRVSEGCTNCYAERQVHRGMSPQHRGLTVMGANGPRWNGAVNYVPSRFDEMLRTKGPAMWFINSLSDLFFEPVPFTTIAALLGMMAVAHEKHGHVAQILTKRPERAVEFFAWLRNEYEDPRAVFQSAMGWFVGGAPDELKVKSKAWDRAVEEVLDVDEPFPFWLGVTTENQETADERIPLLLQCPAAVRWVSAEPLLGPLRLSTYGTGTLLNWVVVGGESGPGARIFDVAHGRAIVEQCRLADVPVFFKQVGSNAIDSDYGLHPLTSTTRKGGALEDLPEDLRVREFPHEALSKRAL